MTYLSGRGLRNFTSMPSDVCPFQLLSLCSSQIRLWRLSRWELSNTSNGLRDYWSWHLFPWFLWWCKHCFQECCLLYERTLLESKSPGSRAQVPACLCALFLNSLKSILNCYTFYFYSLFSYPADLLSLGDWSFISGSSHLLPFL